MLYSGVVRQAKKRVVPEPKKKFSCKNEKLGEHKITETMAQKYLKSVSSGSACTAFLNTAYYEQASAEKKQ
jgi:hypothetical protein